jgi:hypothetical protein
MNLKYSNFIQTSKTENQSGKSTTDQQFALQHFLEKSIEFNITTYHLFIDFKAAYDTITRNEIFVIMAETNAAGT